MAIYRNFLDGGTDGLGTTGRITPLNSENSGEPFTHVVDSSGQRWNYAAHPLGGDGLVAYRTNDTTSAHIRGFDPTASGRGGMRRSFYLPSSPAAFAVFAQIRTAAETLMGSASIDTSRRIQINQGSGVGVITASRSGPLPTDELLTLEFFQTPADPATGGTAELYVFDDTGTDIWSWSDTTTTNTSPPAQYRFGGFSSNELPYDWFEEAAWGAVPAGLIGPYVPLVAPALYYSADGETLEHARLFHSPDGVDLVELAIED